jgi:predicted N-acetyltransferase YhbS
MIGPRRLVAHELPALEILVDTVFMNGTAGAMRRLFPTLFNDRNVDNLLVFSEMNRIASHVGRVERWASLGGCTVRVGCVGAVATHEEFRGRNLASQLLAQACADASASGVDFLMISGGRGLYRRAGAAEVGLDFRATVEPPASRALALGDVGIRPYEDGDLSVWTSAYQRKIAHYIRPAEDWSCALQSRVCQTHDADFLTVTYREMPCGYLVCRVSEDDWSCHVMEYAGDAVFVCAALELVMERHDVRVLRMAIQGTDPFLLDHLKFAGALLEPEHTSGTLLVLNFPQLIDRLRPWFEMTAGLENAHKLAVCQEGGRFAITCGDESVELDSLASATEFVFGHHERNRPTGVFARLFPVPTLRYGLSFV